MPKIIDYGLKRREVLEATVKAGATVGIEGCTSKKVAQVGKLTEANIFRYFINMNDIRKKAYCYVVSGWIEEIEKIADEADQEEEVFLRALSYCQERDEELRYILKFLNSNERDEDTRLFNEDSAEKLKDLIERITGKRNLKIETVYKAVTTALGYMNLISGELIPAGRETTNQLYKILKEIIKEEKEDK